MAGSHGSLELDDSADLTVDLQSQDLAVSDDLGARVRRALGAADATVAGFGGSGAFKGRWRGTLHAPVFEGRFSGRNVTYLGVTWGAADWAGVVTADDVISRSLVVHRPGGELWMDGRAETGDYGQRDGIDLRLRFRGWPAGDFLRALDWRLPMEGLVSGEAAVSGRRSAPFGAVRLETTEGRWYNIPFSQAVVGRGSRGIGPRSRKAGPASAVGVSRSRALSPMPGTTTPPPRPTTSTWPTSSPNRPPP